MGGCSDIITVEPGKGHCTEKDGREQDIPSTTITTVNKGTLTYLHVHNCTFNELADAKKLIKRQNI